MHVCMYVDSIYSDGRPKAAAEIARGTSRGVVDHGDPVLPLGAISQGEGLLPLSVFDSRPPPGDSSRPVGLESRRQTSYLPCFRVLGLGLCLSTR